MAIFILLLLIIVVWILSTICATSSLQSQSASYLVTIFYREGILIVVTVTYTFEHVNYCLAVRKN